MTILDEKEKKKKRYAAKKMEENARIVSLSVRQHETLAWLCKIRHEMHCDPKVFLYPEGDNYDKFIRYIDNGSNSGIMGRLRQVGLPDFSWSFHADINDLCYEMSFCDKAKSKELIENINNDIENYLTLVDEKYGTDYCPSGYARNSKRNIKVKRKVTWLAYFNEEELSEREPEE